MQKRHYILSLLLLIVINLYAQEPNSWDNQIFIGNKVNWGGNTWRYSGEIQSRYIDNARSLDRWYLEGVATYMPAARWEIVPDFRLSVLPTITEYRPGIGVVRKHLLGKGESPSMQLVQQLKFQTDISSNRVTYGARYIIFYNQVITDKILVTGLGGVFYSWKPDYEGLEYIRAGAGMAYVLDKMHSINLTYFAGIADAGSTNTYSGSLVLQLIINIRRDYKYVPAKYINF